MTRLPLRVLSFIWPLRWPVALLLLAGNLTRLVPNDSRDAYQLVSIGGILLFALRVLLVDHEAREDRKAAERESRLRLTDQGVDALQRKLEDADATLAEAVGELTSRLDKLDGPDGMLARLEKRLVEVEAFVNRFGSLGK